MAGFIFELRNPDGTPAEPERFESAVPNWSVGNTVLARPGRIFRILAIEAGEEPPPHATWIVERVT